MNLNIKKNKRNNSSFRSISEPSQTVYCYFNFFESLIEDIITTNASIIRELGRKYSAFNTELIFSSHLKEENHNQATLITQLTHYKTKLETQLCEQHLANEKIRKNLELMQKTILQQEQQILEINNQNKQLKIQLNTVNQHNIALKKENIFVRACK